MSLLWKETRVGDNDFGGGPVERSSDGPNSTPALQDFLPRASRLSLGVVIVS